MADSSHSIVTTRVDDALSTMMSRGLSLDKQLVAASKQILMKKIEFQRAQSASSLFPLHNIRAKYTPMNASDAEDNKLKTGLTVCTAVHCSSRTVLSVFSKRVL